MILHINRAYKNEANFTMSQGSSINNQVNWGERGNSKIEVSVEFYLSSLRRNYFMREEENLTLNLSRSPSSPPPFFDQRRTFQLWMFQRSCTSHILINFLASYLYMDSCSSYLPIGIITDISRSTQSRVLASGNQKQTKLIKLQEVQQRHYIIHDVSHFSISRMWGKGLSATKNWAIPLFITGTL